jgi:hypothetical protein
MKNNPEYSWNCGFDMRFIGLPIAIYWGELGIPKKWGYISLRILCFYLEVERYYD